MYFYCLVFIFIHILCVPVYIYINSIYAGRSSAPTSCNCDVLVGAGPPRSIRPQPAPQLGACCALCAYAVSSDAASSVVRLVMAISLVPLLLSLVLRCLFQNLPSLPSSALSASSSGDAMMPSRGDFFPVLNLPHFDRG